MGEVIVVTSGKGGVGKTTTTANVGTGLAAAGRKVVLIDTDIGLRNLDVVMGLENRIVYNPVFQSHDDIQVPQTDIGIDQYNLSSSRRQTGSDVCGRRCFSNTAFS